jgi:hypothetical protein
VLFDLTLVALLLAVGNVAFRRFDPDKPLWRRLLKSLFILAGTAAISDYFGRTGVLIAIGIALLPLICVHAIWLPRHGINGWTAEPRDKYYALRGWPPPNP